MAAAVSCFVFAGAAHAAVSVEFRAMTPVVNVGDSVSVGLFIVSETGDEIAVSAVETVFSWDPSVLHLDGLGAGDSPLLQSNFPGALDGGLNDGNPPADGDGFYLAFANLGDPVFATDVGHLLTTFEFTALAESAATPILPLASGGSPIVETRVYDGVTPNTIITGDLVAGSVTVIPSPATASLALIGGLAAMRRRRTA